MTDHHASIALRNLVVLADHHLVASLRAMTPQGKSAVAKKTGGPLEEDFVGVSHGDPVRPLLCTAYRLAARTVADAASSIDLRNPAAFGTVADMDSDKTMLMAIAPHVRLMARYLQVTTLLLDSTAGVSQNQTAADAPVAIAAGNSMHRVLVGALDGTLPGILDDACLMQLFPAGNFRPGDTRNAPALEAFLLQHAASTSGSDLAIRLVAISGKPMRFGSHPLNFPKALVLASLAHLHPQLTWDRHIGIHEGGAKIPLCLSPADIDTSSRRVMQFSGEKPA